jgi:regulator of cell morphogenesis and NO signaling
MKKEEQVLFPFIKQQQEAKSSCSIVKPEPVRNIISVMERDHDIAGQLCKEIRQLSNDYTPPANACNSISLLFHKLEEFENDLLQHVHLENNILFPKAIALDNK